MLKAPTTGQGSKRAWPGIWRVLAVVDEEQWPHTGKLERVREAERERLGLRQGRGMRM